MGGVKLEGIVTEDQDIDDSEFSFECKKVHCPKTWTPGRIAETEERLKKIKTIVQIGGPLIRYRKSQTVIVEGSEHPSEENAEEYIPHAIHLLNPSGEEVFSTEYFDEHFPSRQSVINS